MSDAGRRLALAGGERARIVDSLNAVLAHASVVAEHLEVAAARQGASTSVWTETQLDDLTAAARALRTAAEATPLLAD